MANDRSSPLRCAIYTRKSSDEGLEQSFNSLDAQREACEAYILSQRHEGWQALATRYDDGGFSGGSMNRPALQLLMQDIEAGNIDLIVVYKVDRLTRALSDFAKMVELFDAKKVSFVSVTQQFNTTTSMGRLTLNVLLSFAQFEREVTGERIRDKIAASKRKGMWMGGHTPLGYDAVNRMLVPKQDEARRVVHLYERYLALGCVSKLKAELDSQGVVSKVRISQAGKTSGGQPYSRGALYELLKNRLYIGDIVHGKQHYPGAHDAIVPVDLWEKVQARLKENVQGHRSGARAKEPSLLVGLVYDDFGRRLTPSHAVKRGKRYRYYVSPSNSNQNMQHTAVRVPALDLEKVVTGRLHDFLMADQALLDLFADKQLSASRQKALLETAHTQAAAMMQGPTSNQREFLQHILERITVKEKSVELTLQRAALKEALISRSSDTSEQLHAKEPVTRNDAPIVLSIAAQLARCGLEVRLVVAGVEINHDASRHSQSLIKALARGRNWYEQLTSREAVSLSTLATESGVNDRYASRILRAAFLAPDIVEAILEGRQPIDLTLDKMLGDLPLSWEAQRRLFGL